MNSKYWFGTLIGCTAVILPAHAEDARPKNRILEEVVVTAQRREENIQEVPISIAAFSGDALDARGVFEAQDLGKVTPGLQFTEQLGYLFPYIRGVGSDAFIPAVDPAVVTYIDGVYLLTAQGVAMGFGGVERVEVLKGPQGTLFGRNATGGAISITTKRPREEWSGSFLAESSDYNTTRFKGNVNGLITDWLGISADYAWAESDHQYTALYYDIPKNELEAKRINVLVSPTESLDISFNYFSSETIGAGGTVQKNIEPSPLATALGIQKQEDNYIHESDHPSDGGGTQEVMYAIVSYSADWFDTKLTLSDQEVQADRQSLDYEGSPLPLIGFIANQIADAQSAELQFSSNDTSWKSEEFEWVVGAYYTEGTGGYDPVFIDVGANTLGSLIANSAGLGFDLPQAYYDLLNALGLSNTPLGDTGTTLDLYGLLDTESESLFFQTTWFATDSLDVTAGARYQKETRYLNPSRTVFRGVAGSGDVNILEFEDDESAVYNFSPKVSVSKSEDWGMYYFTASKGFKGATYNTVNIYDAPEYIEPEEVTNFELGFKGDFLDASLRLNGAVFTTTIDNLQSLYVSLLAGGAVKLENAGQGRTWGAELEAFWTPMPVANPGLVVTGYVVYVDAEYTDYRNGSGFDETTGLSSGSLDFTGNQIVRSPEVTAAIGILQTIPLGNDHEIELALDGNYSSEFYFSAQNVESAKQEAYTLWDARFSYLYVPAGIRLTAFGSNITDEKYHTAMFNNDFGVTATLAYPSRYGVRLSWDF